MASLKLPGLRVPTSAAPEIREFCAAVLEHLNAISGAKGSPQARSVTVKDLVDAGLAKAVVKGDYAHVRQADTTTATSSSSQAATAGFSTAGWDVLSQAVMQDNPYQVLARNNDSAGYVRIPTALLASALGLVNVSSAQEISAPWIFHDIVDVESAALRYNGEQVVTTPGHGLQKPTDETLEVIDADLVITRAQLTEVVVTPAQITADQDDYNPTGAATASILRLDVDAARNITGMAPGIRRVVVNISAFAITLKDADAASAAANRFSFGADLVIPADKNASLMYDPTSTRWRCIAVSP